MSRFRCMLRVRSTVAGTFFAVRRVGTRGRPQRGTRKNRAASLIANRPGGRGAPPEVLRVTALVGTAQVARALGGPVPIPEDVLHASPGVYGYLRAIRSSRASESHHATAKTIAVFTLSSQDPTCAPYGGTPAPPIAPAFQSKKDLSPVNFTRSLPAF